MRFYTYPRCLYIKSPLTDYHLQLRQLLDHTKVKLSWDIRSSYAEEWSTYTQHLTYLLVIHHLIPSCAGPHGGFNHRQVHLNASEIQNVFMVIDFSHVVFVVPPEIIFYPLFEFSRWLMHDVSSVIDVLLPTDPDPTN